MAHAYDELYINKQSMNRVLLEYINNEQFSGISTNEKRKVLSFIRGHLAFVMRMYFGEINGKKNVLTALLDLDKIEELEPNLIAFMTIELLLNCVKMNAEEVRDSLAHSDIHLPSDQEPTLKNEYLTFISKATMRLIEEAARNFGITPKNKKKRPREEEATTSTERRTKPRTILFAEQPTRASTRKKPAPTNQ